ncbi:phosphate transport system regulatory protein PhoU [Thermus scotoductus]|jgi:phosphate transport system protein|uniref:Phosphate-specific transport system accessory protein PhoU n=1 Tax=Thermus scotoductus TaxID=37636 RepID=A0A430URD9_THESC|nr:MULTISPECIES: phosphate signaling complex protein PhoU [Thermus]ETN87340.1 PhoU family transcriptional regulator [Thermus sp. NMX2.A1]RTG91644.1 phosphate transport system regulatory protein PhoU [Thermus scotoductus]RTG92584.1 phosphate transport system regulatory protein PhoU [Thermus scotoductus]RTH01081.1 phosphate transport system regulatory protein PhoU [Thermus scotoductus]RTH07320.1 phosphate transport system regulatory protein PhoU [Thermus scotoductus]
MREVLDKALNELVGETLRMLSLVREMTQKATEALVEGNRAKAEEVIAKDQEVDALELKIENQAVAVIARHQPVASDLRLIFTIIKALTDLERAGDYAMHVAEDALLLAQEPPLKRYVTLPEMGKRLLEMMDTLGKAVAERDPGLARKVVEMDDQVDGLYEEVTRELITYMLEDPRTLTKALTLMRVARSYERLGDHLENIAERVIYWLTGEVYKAPEDVY